MAHLKIILAALITLVALPAPAAPYADALGTCLADNTNGKERKELVRWIFLGIAAHPDIRKLSNATAEDREQASKSVAILFTRLMSEACTQQANAAMQNEGSQAMQVAFGALGQIAMQELMSNPEVSTSLSGFEAYLDQAKINSALSQNRENTDQRK